MICDKSLFFSVTLSHNVSTNVLRDNDPGIVEASPAQPALITSTNCSHNCDESIVNMSIYMEEFEGDSGESMSTCTGGVVTEPNCRFGRMTAQCLSILGGSLCSIQACISSKTDE